MKKVQVDLKAIVKDIRDGKTDEEIKKKHNLSMTSLARIKKALMERNLISREQLKAQSGSGQPKVKSINIKEFLKDFTEKSDDTFLMTKYNLSATRLKNIYDKLIGKGLISEYEYHTRLVKTPELEDAEASPMAASTMIDLVENPATGSRASGWKVSAAEIDLPDSFYKDHSIGGAGQTTDPQKGARKGDSSVVIDLVGKESCPKCGHPKDPHISSKSCAKCGVLFSKVKKQEPRTNKPKGKSGSQRSNDINDQDVPAKTFGSKILDKLKSIGKKDPYDDW